MRVRCPVVVGREPEMAILSDAVERARSGRGAAVFLTGAPGIGKSALARSTVGLAETAGVAVLVGRSVPRRSPMPYRALTEALLSFVGDGAIPGDPELAPFLPALARLVPQWRVADGDGVEDSPVILGAGLLRLLRAMAPGGSVVVLDDLHWADPDTTAVVEYLCDHVRGEPVTVLGTFRDEERSEAGAVVESLRSRGCADVVPLEPLSTQATEAMVAACPLPAGTAPAAALDLVAGAEGVPLFIEELLASASQPGPGRRVPVSVAETVRLRMADLDPATCRVLGCAALLGRRFDWALLPAATGLAEDQVVAALRRCVERQLVEDEEPAFRFRHALIRDGVLDALLRPEVLRLATATLEAVDKAHPGLPGEWCVLAADLSEQAGQPAVAATMLVTAGRRALGQAALGSAEQLLRRAMALEPAVPDRQLATELLVEVLAAAGRVDDAAEVVRKAGDTPDEPDGLHTARLKVLLARAAVAAERWGLADEQLSELRAMVGSDPALLADLTALRAQTAIGRGEVQRARQLASEAVVAAEAAGSAEAACEAWEVVGRAERLHSLPAARAAFDRAAIHADANGLVLCRLRAIHELGTIDLLADGRVDTLELARRLAADAGALTVAAVLDVQLAAGYHLRGRAADVIEAGQRAAIAGKRLGVDGIERAGTCFAVLGPALRGDTTTLDAAIVEAEPVAAGDLGLLASLSGDGRGSCALLTEDRRGAVGALERAAAIGRASPDRLPSPWWSEWALLRAVRGADAQEALREVALVPVSGHNALLCGYAEAVLLGRSGDPAGAAQRFEAAGHPADPGWWVHLGRRLAAEAALVDGWGSPVEWLSAAAEFFDGFPATPVASACRALLRRAGAPLAHRPAGVSDELAELGVTAREAEILVLLGQGLSNRDVAARLYVSPRTVEKHVENLNRKIGAGSRARLIAYAAVRNQPG